MSKIRAQEIADYIGKELIGADTDVSSYGDLLEAIDGQMVFAKKMKAEYLQALNSGRHLLAIVSEEYAGRVRCSHIVSANARLDYIRCLSHFFGRQSIAGGIHPTAVIEPGAKIGEGVTIGAFCYVSSESVIGDHTCLHPHVTLDNKVTIGDNCEIKSGAVIGQEGFGFERDEDGMPLHFPHSGEVIIGNDVFIGSNSTVERATLGATRIEDHVKIDDLVQIGHNSHIGAGSLITVGAIVCGGAILEEQSYLAPHVSVREKVRIGKGGFAGLGAVVLHDIEADSVVVGNPARVLTKKQ